MMDRARFLILGIFFLIFPSISVFSAKDAQSVPDNASITVKAEVNKAVMTIGDPVEYTITIRHLPNIKILSAIPAPSEDLFRVKKSEDIKEEDGQWQIEGKKFTLTSFRLGEFILESVEIRYQEGQGQPKSISSAPLFLKIKSVAEGEEKTDIRGAKSVFDLKTSYRMLILTASGLAVVLMTIFIIRFFLRRKDAMIQALQPPMAPEEEAMFYLAQLFDSDWIRRGKIKEYYLRLSEILRHYFERRLGIATAEQTTSEILESLKKVALAELTLEKIRSVLETSDLVKFAKWNPAPSEIVQTNQTSKQIVTECTPKEPASGV